MKHIKTYEAKISKPEVGDYVLVNIINNFLRDSILVKTLNKSIGKIINIDHNNLFGEYSIEFENILDYGYYHLTSNREEIRSFSKDKNQLKIELEAETYNL